MKIEARMLLEIPEVEEDYPDQAAELKVEMLSRELSAFVRRVSDEHTDTLEEDRVVRWSVAMDLLASFQGNACADLLRKRLEDRKHL